VVLTPEQQALAARHIGLVGVHLRTRVPTPWYPKRDREHDDLFQEGCVGLLRAAARFDPQHDGAFAAYALPRIRGAIHKALWERFSIIRVPARVADGRSLSAVREEQPVSLPEKLSIEAPAGAPFDGKQETIRHVLGWRFERAVQRALGELRRRRWRGRDPCAIAERIAAERLLISRESERTPLRRIARAAGVSNSRAGAYERQLLEAVGRHFASISARSSTRALIRRLEASSFPGTPWPTGSPRARSLIGSRPSSCC